jgi:hypothetical protein
MILLLIGDYDLIKEKAEDIKKSSSFILHDRVTQFGDYKKEYKKYIDSGADVIFIEHHLSPQRDGNINRNEIYPDWRIHEKEMKESIVVLYFKNSIPPNYDLEFICFRLSILNWLILNKNTEVKDIFDNLNNFLEELRIRRI